MRTALGFRAHSGWAAAVAVAGTIHTPTILERRRIVIADPKRPDSRQPFHAAAGLPVRQAHARLQASIESSRALALEAISGIVNSLQSQGHQVEACAVLRASGKPLPELDKILASHALIHTAEGEMFRDVLAWAAERCLLPVTFVREKVIQLTSLPAIAALGKSIGPPWTQDQKYATVAALMALAAASTAINTQSAR